MWRDALWWLPTAAAAAIAVLGCAAVALQPAGPRRKYWLAALLVGSVLAVGASAERQRAARAALGRETAAVVALNAKAHDLEQRLDALRVQSRGRTVAPDIAAKMADYLRPFGSHRVVVSCVPDDVEAYGYANQIANLLRAAGWDAHGPEATAIFGKAPTMGILVYVAAGAQPPEAAKILLDAFARFNIPYQSGVTPETANPDPATVELFVGHKP